MDPFQIAERPESGYRMPMAGGIKTPMVLIRPMDGAVLPGTIRFSGIILTLGAIWIQAGYLDTDGK